MRPLSMPPPNKSFFYPILPSLSSQHPVQTFVWHVSPGKPLSICEPVRPCKAVSMKQILLCPQIYPDTNSDP